MAKNEEVETAVTKRQVVGLIKKTIKIILIPIVIIAIILIFLTMFLFTIFKEDTSDQTYKDNKDYYDNVIDNIDWGED